MALPLESVAGLGPKTAAYLQEQNITSIKSLIKFGAKKLKQAPGFGEARAQAVIVAASEMLVNDKKSAEKSRKKAKPQKKEKEKNKKKDKKSKDKGKNKKKDKKKDKKSSKKK